MRVYGQFVCVRVCGSVFVKGKEGKRMQKKGNAKNSDLQILAVGLPDSGWTTLKLCFEQLKPELMLPKG